MTQLCSAWLDQVLQFAHLDLLIISVLMLIGALVLLRVQRQIAFERQRREENERQLLNALQRVTALEDSTAPPNSAPITFAQDLNHAELKNRLQAPVTNGAAPDKYRHIASLTKQGMSVAQIAEVLNLSLPEANQLVALSRIANRHD